MLGQSVLFEDGHEMLLHGIVMFDGLYAWLKQARDETHGWPPTTQPQAKVTEASEESFPASDPPSFTPVSGPSRPRRN